MAKWTAETVEKEVIAIVAEKLKKDATKIKRASTFTGDLGGDSIETMEVIMAVEDKFDIRVGDEDVRKMQSVGDAIEYVCKMLKEKGEID